MLPTYYRGCWHVVSRSLFFRYRHYSSLIKDLYNPKAFFNHAALLRQGCPHCAIFPTAASRRSLGRVSVPMWPFNLSVRLLIVALVASSSQSSKPLAFRPCDQNALCGISSRFQLLSPTPRQIAHALLTRPPLTYRFQFRRTFQNKPVRLACVRHAASVHPEPGSNSLKIVFKQLKLLKSTLESDVCRFLF